MSKCISEFSPKMLIEISLNKKDVFDLLDSLGYIMISPKGQVIETADAINGNTFCLHKEKHKKEICNISK